MNTVYPHLLLASGRTHNISSAHPSGDIGLGEASSEAGLGNESGRHDVDGNIIQLLRVGPRSTPPECDFAHSEFQNLVYP